MLVPISLWALTALAAPSGTVPVQGHLTDVSDVPIDGTLPVTFALHEDAGASTSLWTSTRTVTFDEGAFAVQLGAITALDLALFKDHPEGWLTIDVNGAGALGPFPIGSIPAAAFAHHADDAQTLGGLPATTFATGTDLASLQARVTALESQLSTAQTQANTALVTANSAATTASNAATAATNATTLAADASADAAAAAAAAAQANTDIDAHDTRISAIEADYLTAADLSAPTLVGSDLTITVPGDFPTIPDAIESLDNAWISPGATVTVQLLPGDHVLTEPLEIRHPHGDRIHLVGSGNRLIFPQSDGIVVSGGHAVGLVDEVLIEGGFSPGTRGVVATLGSRIRLGTAVQVAGFGGSGVVADAGSVILADGVLSSFNDGYGFLADRGSVLVAALTNTQNNQGGYGALRSSTLLAPQSIASDDIDVGYDAGDNSFVDASATQTSNNRNGYRSAGGSFVSAAESVIFNTIETAFGATLGAALDARDATTDGAGWSGYAATVGGSISAPSATSQLSGHSAFGPPGPDEGSGFYAADGGTIFAPGSQATDNQGLGYLAVGGGYINLEFGVASSNFGDGVRASAGSTAWARDAESSNNQGAGLWAEGQSFIRADNAFVFGNPEDYGPLPDTEGNGNAWMWTANP